MDYLEDDMEITIRDSHTYTRYSNSVIPSICMLLLLVLIRKVPFFKQKSFWIMIFWTVLILEFSFIFGGSKNSIIRATGVLFSIYALDWNWLLTHHGNENDHNNSICRISELYVNQNLTWKLERKKYD